MKYINVKTTDGVQSAEVLRENAKTWIVKLRYGKGFKTVKRHKVKHAAP